ncbi:hypothetical protein AKJ09_08516 [Labilithrix luteola]|uniref:Lipoprotein n=1 Tax=Labilithrix luteola TaxID=1391654 RepID=A0A0K1Q7Y7_9BACT|nr:hypothetical protein [Labilithrix luteola]AKV01853.1 hypothetical protein AKJ09_08516 [Labilithrix luteola]
MTLLADMARPRSLAVFAFAPIAVLLPSACTTSVTGTGTRIDTTADGGPPPSSDSNGTTTDDSQPSEYDALFGPPEVSSLTDDSLFGLWAGATLHSEVRVAFARDTIVIAQKCGSAPAVGLSVAATVTANAIKLLESKSLKNEWEPCSLKVSPIQIPACAAIGDIGCFTLTGSVLDVSGVALFKSEGYAPNSTFTKLSD